MYVAYSVQATLSNRIVVLRTSAHSFNAARLPSSSESAVLDTDISDVIDVDPRRPFDLFHTTGEL